MDDEYFDLVNGRDEVVGRTTRREAHARGLRHRAVHVLLFDSSGRVYLQKRSLRKDVAPGLWDSSCSGHVNAGEDYDAAAVRELREELGLALRSAPPRWFRAAACGDTGQEFVWVYRWRHDGPLSPDPVEIDRGEWRHPADVDSRIRTRPEDFSRAFRFIWDLSRRAAAPEARRPAAGRGLCAPDRRHRGSSRGKPRRTR